ncbi:hypothetical protein ACHQM5_001425 [Ranunculus cassubicifolius]
MCRDKKLLVDTRNVKIEEQVAEFLHTVGHNIKNRVINHSFMRSGETISRYFHTVLKAVLSLQNDLMKQPTSDDLTPPKIQNNRRFSPWFKNCVGAIDGTHIRVSVPESIRNRFRGRKVFPTQNVLAAVTFDLKFTYVLAGWEGSAHDARILEDALTRANGLKVPKGKYYLVDAGYTNQNGFLAPFRGTRYHLQEWKSKGKAYTEWDKRKPKNAKELFNHRHSSLRNTVERAFGVLKNRWKILDDSEPFFSYDTQVEVVLACCILHNYIKEVDPNDIIFAQVEKEMEAQAAMEAQVEQEMESQGSQKKIIKKVKHTQREKSRENQKWKAFREKLAEDMWRNYQRHNSAPLTIQ